MIAGIIYDISVFVGIIAGIGVDYYKEKRQTINDKKNLSFSGENMFRNQITQHKQIRSS